MSEKNKILDTSVTWEDLQQKCFEIFGLAARFGPNKRVQNISDGKGNVGRVSLIESDWGEDLKPSKFLIKICIIPQQSDGSGESDYAPTQRKLHNVECTAYKILTKHKHEDIPIPQIYAAIPFTEENMEKGFILMEYIENAKIKYIYENLGIDEVKQVLRSIAALQAVSLKFTPEERDNLSFNPLYEIFAQMNKPNTGKAKDTVSTGNIVAKFVEGTYLEPRMKEYFKILPEIYDIDWMYKKMKEDFGITPVFVHGDAWSNNFLWREEGGRLQLETIFDFQTAYLGLPGGDVMRVIASFLSGKDQKEYADGLLEYFYRTFLNYLGSTSPPYTLEKLRENIKRYYPLVRLLFAIPQSFDQNKEKFDDEEKKKIKEVLLEKMEHILDKILACNERNQQLKAGKE